MNKNFTLNILILNHNYIFMSRLKSFPETIKELNAVFYTDWKNAIVQSRELDWP